jgi:hypothetical protein
MAESTVTDLATWRMLRQSARLYHEICAKADTLRQRDGELPADLEQDLALIRGQLAANERLAISITSSGLA